MTSKATISAISAPRPTSPPSVWPSGGSAFLAHNDALTGLLNRGKFTDHLKQCVARLERYGSPFTLLFLDLDQFKSVNDSRGHLIGDKLLIQVAHRIRSCVRESDIVARLGGDEFAIILSRPSENDGDRRAGRPARRDGRQALRIRRRDHVDRRQHRHRHRADQRHAAGPDPAQRRSRPLSRQGGGAGHVPLLRIPHGFGRARTAHAGNRAAPGAEGRTNSFSTISRWSRPKATGRAAWRRWCAGTIRSAASCRPPSSSRSPSRPG